jgi:hypothetical protein
MVRIRRGLVAPQVENTGLSHTKGSAVKVELSNPAKSVMLEGENKSL